jgi:hypothetical protein
VFVDLNIQHAMRMRRIILSVASPGLSYFSLLSHKRHDFQKTGTEAKMYVLISPTKLSHKFPILTTAQPHVTIYVQRAAFKVTVMWVTF